MASDRVLIVRILGLGVAAGVNDALTLTSRAGLSYLASQVTINGVVADMGSQLSSDLALFGALGSDPTTTVSVLATERTSQLLLSRGKVPLLQPDGANVTVTEYVKPFGPSNSGSLYVTDTTNAYAGQMLRVANTVFEVSSVTSSTVLAVRRRWGSADVPIPMGVTGFGIFGATVYDVSPTVPPFAPQPTGGAESLPIVISTADLTATARSQEEVIFRGIVNKVTTDKQAGGRNLLRLDCGSIMSFVRSAKFTPARGATRLTLKQTDALAALNAGGGTIGFFYQMLHDQRLYGAPFEVTGATGDVRVPLLQVRDAGFGGLLLPDPVAPWSNATLDGFSVYVAQAGTQYHIDPFGSSYMTGNTFIGAFRDGYYSAVGVGPSLDPQVTPEAIYSSRDVFNGSTTETVPVMMGYTYQMQQGNFFNDKIVGETAFVCSDLATGIIDLLLGTFNGDTTYAIGCRAATEAAWLPFGIQGGVLAAQDIIDLPSLIRACDAPGVVNDELPTTEGGNINLLPYVHEDVKTVGDVLETLLKRLGMFCAYDAGKFRFGRWAARPPAPTVVNDTGLAEPRISMAYDRQNCLQTVEMTLCWSISGESVTTQKIPVNNVDLGLGALGKVIAVSPWNVSSTIADLPYQSVFANAVQMVTRYSQAAPTIDVVYRDAVFDLFVGQQVAFSSDYVANAEGGMGVTLANGIVLKAARSWQTPTTAYTIALPGYLSTINRLSVFSCSGTVVSVSGNDIVIAPNDFTQPSGVAGEAAPTSDTEAFDLTLSLQGGPVTVVLRDQYGTALGASGILSAVNVATNTLLNLPLIAAAASPGDVIVLARATGQTSVATLWDCFQADTAGQVTGSAALAYKWVL